MFTTSQTFGRILSFSGFSSILLFLALYINNEAIQTMKEHGWNVLKTAQSHAFSMCSLFYVYVLM